ncbi:transcriptional regulator, TetR family [Butyrivibrio proteoclasticus]|uniref:Transcriptional regulator, TetR family n=1 Tax=Butyrivibrio proteoclasticus TaxID=43305 RepID=A0A1I5T6T3_9FIRM|nr:TetR/AcrR family transcriptional regulator [Butyrivibrio proteoclasticus]SFP78541.1 transcriptional regulator, TetR family [Butyrivibrio proteoclasticus]
MNEKFFELKKEKQDRMINAALLVFSSYGYYHASTDEIVKVAEISKGLLFHYFGSKIGLYSFLYDYATRFVTLELAQNVDKGETGYFELYKQIVTAKAASMGQYPYIYLFLKRAEEETYAEALSEILERREKYQRIMEALRERADITVFPPEISYNNVWNMLDYTVDGVMEKELKQDTFRSDLFLEEVIEYIDMVSKMVLS